MPAHVTVRFLPAVLALLALMSGCVESTTRPPAASRNERASGIADVQLTLSVLPPVGGPSQPISMEISVVKVGEGEVWRCEGCGCRNGISLTVLGPDGTPVALTDPAAPVPLCPDVFKPLEPNSPVRTDGQFTGTLYERDSSKNPTPTYAAPPGTYTVVAQFAYAMSRDGGSKEVKSTTAFVWKP